jgi:small-conductance mechanosensitive channel
MGFMINISQMIQSINLDFLDSFENGFVIDIVSTILTLIIAVTIFYIVYSLIKQVLLKMAKTKRHISNINMFLNIIKYVFSFFLILILISSYFGTWIELGLTAGLLTAAVGWALQKPITGMAAWIMIAIKRPFGIGDRVIIKDIKGDIIDITLTHIYLAEIGGTIDGEEQSGRISMIPNSLLFEVEIINYTKQHDYILDEVTTSITYESNLKKAEKIMMESVKKIMGSYHSTFPKRIPLDSHTRLNFMESGMGVTVRYYTLAKKRNSIATDISREIYSRIRKTNDVEIAYPHTEVILGKKG